MKFIEIADGISVNLESVNVIEKISDLETRVICGEESYITNIPYQALRDLLSRKVKEAPSASDEALRQLAKFQTRTTP